MKDTLNNIIKKTSEVPQSPLFEDFFRPRKHLDEDYMGCTILPQSYLGFILFKGLLTTYSKISITKNVTTLAGKLTANTLASNE